MDLRDASLLINQVRDAAGVLILGRVRRAVRQADLVVGVAKQRKVELLFFREFLIGFYAVEAGADDLRVLRGVVAGEVPEPETFCGSARCVGLGKEPQDDFLSAKVAELDAAAEMIGRFEVRSGITDLQHGWTSSHALHHMTQHSAD
jgi:hypothetical protein